jgi:hypothetical protein
VCVHKVYKCVYKDCIWRGNIVCGSKGDKRYTLCKWCKGYCKRMLGMILGRIVGDLVVFVFSKNEIKRRLERINK